MARKCAECGKKIWGLGHELGKRKWVQGDTHDYVPTLEFCSEEHREAYRSRLKKRASEPESAPIVRTSSNSAMGGWSVETTERRSQPQFQLHGSGDPTTNVRLVGLDVPIGDLIMFMLKWVLASIPAGIVIFLAITVIIGIISSL